MYLDDVSESFTLVLLETSRFFEVCRPGESIGEFSFLAERLAKTRLTILLALEQLEQLFRILRE